jgi:hypothetical protein
MEYKERDHQFHGAALFGGRGSGTLAERSRVDETERANWDVGLVRGIASVGPSPDKGGAVRVEMRCALWPAFLVQVDFTMDDIRAATTCLNTRPPPSLRVQNACISDRPLPASHVVAYISRLDDAIIVTDLYQPGVKIVYMAPRFMFTHLSMPLSPTAFDLPRRSLRPPKPPAPSVQALGLPPKHPPPPSLTLSREVMASLVASARSGFVVKSASHTVRE